MDRSDMKRSIVIIRVPKGPQTHKRLKTPEEIFSKYVKIFILKRYMCESICTADHPTIPEKGVGVGWVSCDMKL